VPFDAAWTRPTRRVAGSAGSLSDQSLTPVNAVGPYAASPTPMSLRAPASPERPPTRSRIVALVKLPMTTSVSSGWSAWPSHVPLTRSLSAPAPSVDRTFLATGLATPSSASSDSTDVMTACSGEGAVGVLMRGDYPREPGT
jgi:hypothetical protein